MKKGYYCPKCGNMEAISLLITTLDGKNLTVLMASQATLNKPDIQIRCLKCTHLAKGFDFRIKRG